MPSSFALRWVGVSVFIISSTLNYLDRNLLSLLAPLIISSLHCNQTQLGFLISLFSIAYAGSSLFTGWMLDRFGVNRTMTGAVGLWSLAAIGHGAAVGFGSLGFFRALLGLAESPSSPAVGKLNGLYLKPEERALGAAANQIGLSLASIIGPLWVGFAIVHGWRTPFLLNGVLGLLWIPLWLVVNRAIPARYGDQEIAKRNTGAEGGGFAMLRDRNLLILMAANVLWMAAYSIWTNWLSLYLIHVHHITLAETPHYVWIPPLISNLGGFFGGWLSLRLMRRGKRPLDARRNAVWVSAFCSLFAILLPFAPDAAWATLFISISYFSVLAGSVNIYALPIDLFGAGRAGFGLAALTLAFGIMQAILSPLIGHLGDLGLYSQVIWLVTVPLFASAWLLMACREPDASTN